MQSLIAWLNRYGWRQLSTIAQTWTAPVSVLRPADLFSFFFYQSSLPSSLCYKQNFYFAQCPKRQKRFRTLFRIWTMTWRYLSLNVSFTEWRDEANKVVRLKNWIIPFYLRFFELKIFYFFANKKQRIVGLIVGATAIKSGDPVREAVRQVAKRSLSWFFYTAD